MTVIVGFMLPVLQEYDPFGAQPLAVSVVRVLSQTVVSGVTVSVAELAIILNCWAMVQFPNVAMTE